MRTIVKELEEINKAISIKFQSFLQVPNMKSWDDLLNTIHDKRQELMKIVDYEDIKEGHSTLSKIVGFLGEVEKILSLENLSSVDILKVANTFKEIKPLIGMFEEEAQSRLEVVLKTNPLVDGLIKVEQSINELQGVIERSNKKYPEKEFPDIPIVPEGILRSASQGRLIVFIGAGVSKIIGCPLWDEFAQKVLRYLYDNRCINFREFDNLCKLDPRKLLSICKQILSDKKQNLSPNFREMLSPNEKLMEKYKIYENLYLWKAIYVTTNFDGCLDKMALEKRPIEITLMTLEGEVQLKIEPEISPKIISSKEELLISNLNQGNVLHLHGSIEDENSLIITTSDYLKHYTVGSKAVIILEEIFKSYTVLFVGYGLEEYEILEYLMSKAQPIKRTLQHYMLYPMFKEESNLFEFQKKYYAELGIELVPYPIGQNGYEHLANVIQEWAKIIGPKSRPQGFYERARLIDEVI